MCGQGTSPHQDVVGVAGFLWSGVGAEYFGPRFPEQFARARVIEGVVGAGLDGGQLEDRFWFAQV